MIVHAEPYPSLLAVQQKIDYIEIFLCSPVQPPCASSSLASQPREIWLHLYCGGRSGWASCPVPSACRHVDPLHYGALFARWKGLSVEECLEAAFLHEDNRDMPRIELAKSALLNMFGATEANSRLKHSRLMDAATSYCYYKIN